MEEGKGDHENSVLWNRTSQGIFFPDGDEYLLLQIINGNGDPIEPAYQDWIEIQSDPNNSGHEPNVNYFSALNERKGFGCSKQ